MGPVLRAIGWNLALGSPLRPASPAVRRHSKAPAGTRRLPAAFAASASEFAEEWRENTRKLIGPVLARRLARGGRKLRVPRPRAPVDRNLALAGELFGLEPLEREVLLFAVATNCAPWLCDHYVEEERFQSGSAAHDVAAFIAAGLGRSQAQVLEALRPNRALVRSGLLRCDGYNSIRLQLDPRLLDACFEVDLTRETLQGRFVALEPAPTLALRDFAHLGGAAEFALRLVRSSLDAGRMGVNLLFHGPTGVGKTELARLLAREAGAALYSIGRAGEHELSPTPGQRLASALVGQRVVDARRGLLLFDEMEDVLGDAEPVADIDEAGDVELRPASVSKLWFNDLVERNRVVTIWITNDPDLIDPALLRRFALVVDFPPASAALRRRVLDRCLSPEAHVSPEERDQLATRFSVSPAQIATAVNAARLVAADGRETTGDLERVLAPAAKLATGRDAPPARPLGAAGYLLDAVNSPVDLAALVERLASAEHARRGITLCLYGPPGTGKTEFVHYLARRMGLAVLERSVSDLLSCYVGETEQNIAQTFRDAEEDGALLLFDEADSLLLDRRGANRSWEVTQTNEFLQRLERFRGVAACTTNLFRTLDQAALRRFVFKIPFLPLRPEQALMMFERVLGPSLSAALDDEGRARLLREFSRTAAVTPGDFAAVARRLAALQRRCCADDLLAEVRSELAVKEGPGRAIGF